MKKINLSAVIGNKLFDTYKLSESYVRLETIIGLPLHDSSTPSHSGFTNSTSEKPGDIVIPLELLKYLHTRNNLFSVNGGEQIYFAGASDGAIYALNSTHDHNMKLEKVYQNQRNAGKVEFLVVGSESPNLIVYDRDSRQLEIFDRVFDLTQQISSGQNCYLVDAKVNNNHSSVVVALMEYVGKSNCLIHALTFDLHNCDSVQEHFQFHFSHIPHLVSISNNLDRLSILSKSPFINKVPQSAETDVGLVSSSDLNADQPESCITWLQSKEDVTIYILLPSAMSFTNSQMSSRDFQISFDERKVVVHRIPADVLQMLQDQNLRLMQSQIDRYQSSNVGREIIIDQHLLAHHLFGEIKPSESFWLIEKPSSSSFRKQPSPVLQIHLEKKHVGTRWPSLFQESIMSVPLIDECLDPNEVSEIMERMEKYTKWETTRTVNRQPLTMKAIADRVNSANRKREMQEWNSFEESANEAAAEEEANDEDDGYVDIIQKHLMDGDGAKDDLEAGNDLLESHPLVISTFSLETGEVEEMVACANNSLCAQHNTDGSFQVGVQVHEDLALLRSMNHSSKGSGAEVEHVQTAEGIGFIQSSKQKRKMIYISDTSTSTSNNQHKKNNCKRVYIVEHEKLVFIYDYSDNWQSNIGKSAVINLSIASSNPQPETILGLVEVEGGNSLAILTTRSIFIFKFNEL